MTREFSELPLELPADAVDAAHDLRWAALLAVARFQPHPIDGGGKLSLAQVDAIEHLENDDRRSAAERLVELFELLDRVGVGDRVRSELRSPAASAERTKAENRRRRGGLPPDHASQGVSA